MSVARMEHGAPGEFLGESSPNLAKAIGIWMMGREAHDGRGSAEQDARGKSRALDVGQDPPPTGLSPLTAWPVGLVLPGSPAGRRQRP